MLKNLIVDTSVGLVSTYFDTSWYCYWHFFLKIDTRLVLVLATFHFFDTSLVLVLGSILILGWYMASMWHKIRAEMATILFYFSSVNRHNHNYEGAQGIHWRMA